MRGLRNIRSSAGKMSRAAVPKQAKDHELFMQITCLEMEKVRRGVERAAVLERIRSLDARLNQMEAEKTLILAQLAERGSQVPQVDLRADSFTGSASDAGPSRTFRIRY